MEFNKNTLMNMTVGETVRVFRDRFFKPNSVISYWRKLHYWEYKNRK